MAGSERRRFVEEEELGIRARLHDCAMYSAPREAACYPAPYLRRAYDAPMIVVQHAAIAHHEPPSRKRDDLPVRRHAILQRHDAMLSHPVRYAA
jgi:hypothetical protein